LAKRRPISAIESRASANLKSTFIEFSQALIKLGHRIASIGQSKELIHRVWASVDQNSAIESRALANLKSLFIEFSRALINLSH
jgi:hypothetical protein